MKADTITLRLTVNVTFNLNGANPKELIANLESLPTMAASEGMFTADAHEAEVESWDSNVEVIKAK